MHHERVVGVTPVVRASHVEYSITDGQETATITNGRDTDGGWEDGSKLVVVRCYVRVCSSARECVYVRRSLANDATGAGKRVPSHQDLVASSQAALEIEPIFHHPPLSPPGSTAIPSDAQHVHLVAYAIRLGHYAAQVECLTIQSGFAAATPY